MTEDDTFERLKQTPFKEMERMMLEGLFLSNNKTVLSPADLELLLKKYGWTSQSSFDELISTNSVGPRGRG